eukprot:COSAG06_NODE_1354_length_9748_cov_3.365841_4_plen_264_part_00
MNNYLLSTTVCVCSAARATVSLRITAAGPLLLLLGRRCWSWLLLLRRCSTRANLTCAVQHGRSVRHSARGSTSTVARQHSRGEAQYQTMSFFTRMNLVWHQQLRSVLGSSRGQSEHTHYRLCRHWYGNHILVGSRVAVVHASVLGYRTCWAKAICRAAGRRRRRLLRHGRRRVVYLFCRGFGIGQVTPSSPWALFPRIPSARSWGIYRAASGGVAPVVRRTHGLCLISAAAARSAVRREPRTRRPAAAGGLAVASRRYHKRMC